ncbi:bifunctional DNA primase/polymerase [Streptomyces sp. BA2]|uniref:bifunctional DNA primase/polymerase n=1 Tax=Streptomyces sp. BA2 TaxID=436595 RepID=UPI001320C153|nr:bifunctional DNA primase/polymerase [Streptomyces sp. BA2]MWA11198.1 DNA primase [Streptomyces sp. BA2]
MTHDARPALLSAALDAAARGWPVHPLRPGGKGSALHGERSCTGRSHCTNGHVKWEQRATCDPERIRRTWQSGAFNVGIAPGPAHLLVVDLDIPKGKDGSDAPCGATNFQALCEHAGAPWPATYTVRTPSGGLHLYFHTASRLPSTAGALAERIDTRAWGGNIVAAGSHTSQGAYVIEVHGAVAELPDWLHTLLQPPAVAPGTARLAPLLAPGTVSRRASVALEREAAQVAGTGEGGRNQRLLAGARALGRFVAWGEIPRHVVEEAFQAAGEAAGLSASECTATIRSALNWSIRTARPREAA